VDSRRAKPGSRREWGELYIFVDPPEAARDFLRHLRWLPGELEAYREIASDPERYAAWEAGEFRAPDAAAIGDDGAAPANGRGTVPPPPTPPAAREDEIVEGLRERGCNTPAALVKFMIGKRSASFEDIALHVHCNSNTKPEAIRKNVSRVHTYLEGIRSTIRYKIHDPEVYKIDESQ
jgi:hypothetical protein